MRSIFSLKNKDLDSNPFKVFTTLNREDGVTENSPLLMSTLFKVDFIASAIKCKKCEQKFDSCDIGECTGQSCVTIEASNAQSKIVVKKMCSKDKVQKTECFITFPDGIESIQCQCAYDFCNADRELAKIGLKVPVGGGPNVGRNDDGRYYDSRKIRTSSASSTNLYSYRNILLYIFLIFYSFWI
uniref:Uncharacterized protein n=1 Tax=Romanomermis culicivorax TaxID=13658 RepID=A0A915K0A9_ROMCU